MKLFYRSSPYKYIILAILINLLLFSLFFCFITPRYQSNDDSTMEGIASGIRTGQPSEYLVFIDILIGKLLVFLYSNLININWYPVLFYLLHFISMSIMCFCLLLRKKFLPGLAFYLLIFAFFELFLLTNIQFTTTSFVSAISGVILFLSFLDSRGSRFYIATVISIFLFIISEFIRHYMSFLVLGLFSILLLFKFIKKPGLKIPVFLIITAVLFTLIYFHNINYYQKDPKWAFYIQYNKLRPEISDYPQKKYSESTKDVYRIVGWSENDVKMYKSWFFSDLELYSLEKVQYIVDSISNDNGPKETFDVWKKAFNDLNLKIRIFTIFFLIVLIIEAIKNRNKYLLFTTIPPFIISLYFSYTNRLPNRLFIPLIFFTILTSAFFKSDFVFLTALKSKKKTFMLISLAVCIIIFSSIFITTSIASRTNFEKQEEFNEKISRMKEHDFIYVRWGAAPLHDKKISFTIPENLKGLKYIQQGWLQHSPIYNEILLKYSIENIYTDIILRNDIRVLCTKDQGKLLKIFIEEHYGVYIESSIDSNFNGGYNITSFYIPDGPLSLLFKRAYFYKYGKGASNDEALKYYKLLQTGGLRSDAIGIEIKKILLSEGSLLESKSDKEFLIALYAVFFDRKPDITGQVMWLQKLSNGYSRSDIIDSFLASVEFQKKYKDSLDTL